MIYMIIYTTWPAVNQITAVPISHGNSCHVRGKEKRTDNECKLILQFIYLQLIMKCRKGCNQLSNSATVSQCLKRLNRNASNQHHLKSQLNMRGTQNTNGPAFKATVKGSYRTTTQNQPCQQARSGDRTNDFTCK